MPQRDEAWLHHQQQRWLRPDAYRWVRPDAARILPGSDVVAVHPGLAARPDQRHDRRIAEANRAHAASLAELRASLEDIAGRSQALADAAKVSLGEALEDMTGRFAEESASSEIWPLLKRTDEKWITERAYENPKFVEDLVRDVALRLNGDPRIGRYHVEVENFESIHNHSAFAVIDRE